MASVRQLTGTSGLARPLWTALFHRKTDFLLIALDSIPLLLVGSLCCSFYSHLPLRLTSVPPSPIYAAHLSPPSPHSITTTYHRHQHNHHYHPLYLPHPILLPPLPPPIFPPLPPSILPPPLRHP